MLKWIYKKLQQSHGTNTYTENHVIWINPSCDSELQQVYYISPKCWKCILLLDELQKSDCDKYAEHLEEDKLLQKEEKI